jgi:hypothetical protein
MTVLTVLTEVVMDGHNIHKHNVHMHTFEDIRYVVDPSLLHLRGQIQTLSVAYIQR